MRMTQESIDAFLEHQKQNGASKDVFRQRKGFVTSLFHWLPEDKELTKARLNIWREDMLQKGYTRQTVSNYVKGINLYLDYMGWSDIRFKRGRAKDIRDLAFGYLIPMEPTASRYRGDIVWRCKCKCGNIVELPATRLLMGNTLSCGCLKAENILSVNKHIAGTQLSQSLKETVKNPKSISGYTGVAPKRDKWYAHITYRGKRYYLGTYLRLEDAVKARARAKELVVEDARKLLEDYEAFHKDDYKPDRLSLPKVETAALQDEKERPPFRTVVRSNNTSGYPGVSRKRNKWIAYISYKGKKRILGSFDEKDDAITARKEAEKQLMEDPQSFVAV